MAIVGAAFSFEDVASANCGPGAFLTDQTRPYQCGIDSNGSPVWGTQAFCYIQSCNDDKIPANQGPCWSYIWCPGQASRPGACAEAMAAGPNICPFTVASTYDCR